MLYATTAAGPDTEPSPGATGTCPLCGGPVLARCGQVNVWHWAHQANKDCDPWAEALTDWHRAYQRLVPAERSEVIVGKHRADVVTATGQVLELQHSSISVDDIAAREAHYGQGMAWLFDARTAYEMERLNLRRGNNDEYVSFRWKQPRRSVLACARPVLLDLGEGLILRIKKIYPGPPYGGWGDLYETAEIWRWLRDGTIPTPLRWTGSQHSDLVARIVRTAAYLRGDSSPLLAEDEANRVMKAALFAGDNPSDEVRAALHSATRNGIDLTGLSDYAELQARWYAAGVFGVLCCCGEWHHCRIGPDDHWQWYQWAANQTWPQTMTVICPTAPERTHTLQVPAPHTPH